ncbi:L,D-transpeptidase [Sphingosinicella rhizophila]|uniref:L,D-transpeptidase n=1 Tax=Sphingosinicella rhizophila TaxID=3050082 RepID=A0ABU3Q7I3_9SPHN|nr:L,D-transpeptidase [Sphingosinicella sp. GR2756]MDT9599363.1 L,D-transpeptidase [Sphingosinicella sp. GR2756]
MIMPRSRAVALSSGPKRSGAGRFLPRIRKAIGLVLFAASFVPAHAVSAQHRTGTVDGKARQERHVDSSLMDASADVREVAAWILRAGDNQGLPYVIIDKVGAKVFLFDGQGRARGSAPALLGLALGDESVPGIGDRRLATISAKERTTPAGRFMSSLGHDFEQDILWVDYASSLSLHRVIAGHPKERRHQRLVSATPLDNRISYGCINVPAEFYDKVVIPAFTGTMGVVYILPETRSVRQAFAIPAD